MFKKKKRNKKRLKRWLWAFIGIDVLLFGFIMVAAYGHGLYSKMDTGALVLEEGEVLVSEEVLEQKKGTNVKNIALFGVDSRQDSYSGTRSDAIMILSYNKDTKQAALTSVVRDTYAYLGEKYGYDKINHAYSFGGPALAIQALNRQFDLDIEEYVTVNFSAVEALIDKIGGIEVEVKDYEFYELNRVILEMNEYVPGVTGKALTSTGYQTLTGRQAVAYMRIRKVGNGDFERMQRQRAVIELVFEEISQMSKTKLIGLAEELLPYIKTNLTLNDLLTEGLDLVLGGIKGINQYQLPSSELSYGTKLSDGVYYLIPDTLEENVRLWHNEVYGVADYRVTSTVQTISDQISK